MKTVYSSMIALLLAGCVTAPVEREKARYAVEVNSMSTGEKLGSRLAIVPLDSAMAPDDLMFREIASYVAKIMNDRGHTIENDRRNANGILAIAFHISGPQTEEHQSIAPVFHHQPAQTTTYSGYNSSGYRSFGTATTSAGSSTSFVPITETSTSYIRSIVIVALDAKSAKTKPKKIWESRITSKGSSGDLRRVAPAMFAASAEYIGTDTGREMSLSITEDHPAILALIGAARSRKLAQE